MATFDVIFLGGGPAGYVGAIRAAQLGLNVGALWGHASTGVGHGLQFRKTNRAQVECGSHFTCFHHTLQFGDPERAGHEFHVRIGAKIMYTEDGIKHGHAQHGGIQPISSICGRLGFR